MVWPMPECGQWGTIEEFHEAPAATGVRTPAPGRTSRMPISVPNVQSAAKPITSISTDTVNRLPTGFGEFDRVLGGGIVPGSVVLIAGEPGTGNRRRSSRPPGHCEIGSRRA